MGQYLSPPDPQDYTTKCAVIFYPADDGAFYLQALRGQLTALGIPWIWEGDEEKQKQIAQIWIEHDINYHDSFFPENCELVPVLTGEEPMNINVETNCNCGCCSGGGIDNAITIVVGNNPIGIEEYGDLGQTGDDDGQVTVDGIPTDPVILENLPTEEDYDAEACAIMNEIWDDAYNVALMLEDSFSLMILVGNLYQFLLGTGSIKKVAQEVGEAWLGGLAKEIIDIIGMDFITDAVFGGAAQWLLDNRQDFVCALYNKRDNLDNAAVEAALQMQLAMIDGLTSQGISGDNLTIAARAFYKFGYALAHPIRIYQELAGTVNASAPAGAIDCAGCQPGNPAMVWRNQEGDLTFSIQKPEEFKASGTVLEQGVLNDVRTSVSLTQDASTIFGVDVIHGWEFTIVELSSSLKFDAADDYFSVFRYNAAGQEFRVKIGDGTVDLTGQKILVHDGSLSTSGYDHVFVAVQDSLENVSGSKDNGAMVDIISRVGNGESSDVVMHFSGIYPLDVNGDRLT